MGLRPPASRAASGAKRASRPKPPSSVCTYIHIYIYIHYTQFLCKKLITIVIGIMVRIVTTTVMYIYTYNKCVGFSGLLGVGLGALRTCRFVDFMSFCSVLGNRSMRTVKTSEAHDLKNVKIGAAIETW